MHTKIHMSEETSKIWTTRRNNNFISKLVKCNGIQYKQDLYLISNNRFMVEFNESLSRVFTDQLAVHKPGIDASG